jgi:aryl-alcohol dehydrogenase-like predicted oxidoreductase
MQYRRLGKTELTVSIVGVGTWQYGGEWGKDFTQTEVDQIFNTAREEGINLVDTAECYGDHLSEQLVGNAIQRDREKWILATKFGHHFHGYLDRTTVYDPADVRKQLEGSLKALQTDYIDLYQFHSGNNEMFQTPGLWDLLNQFVKAGKVRNLGISVSPNDNLFQIDRATEVGAKAVQVVYNRLDRKPEEGLLQSCQRQDLGVLARVPLASGLLSGKYKPGSKFPTSDVRSTHDAQKMDEKLREVELISKSEVAQGVNMAQWALAWCLKHDAVANVIPGCKDPAQVSSNAAAARLARQDHPQIRPTPILPKR